MRLAIIGGGWAGMAAAVQAAELGAQATVFEAARTLGGRARALAVPHQGHSLPLDNGQHILIGAYRDTLDLMARLGVAPRQALLPLPLGLPFPDGGGLQTPRWAASAPPSLALLVAMLGASGWSWGDRLGLLRQSLRWRAQGFACAPRATVADVCAGLPQRAMDELIEPLCVSALNLPAAQASGAIFLRVLRDALLGEGAQGWAASTLLLPRRDLSALLPDAAAQWLRAHGGSVHAGCRVREAQRQGGGWRLLTDTGEIEADRLVWAGPPHTAADVLGDAVPAPWRALAEGLDHTAITTVYAHAPGARLASPMLALRQGPAQFVFDRGQLQTNEPAAQGVLAFVISASEGEREALQTRVLAQAQAELGLHLSALRTVTDKRATFACTPGLQRPGAVMAPGLWAAGDWVDGPYPATLEGAVRSGREAARLALA